MSIKSMLEDMKIKDIIFNKMRSLTNTSIEIHDKIIAGESNHEKAKQVLGEAIIGLISAGDDLKEIIDGNQEIDSTKITQELMFLSATVLASAFYYQKSKGDN